MSKRILVVEDQEDNRQIIRDMLAATDYEIIEAKNGEEAQIPCVGHNSRSLFADLTRRQGLSISPSHKHDAAHKA